MIRVAAIFGILSLGMLSCDVIDDPIKGDGPVNPPPGNDTVYRNVFIEDFTGHRCKNCPKATKAIEQIVGLYGERVIPLAIHSGASTFTDPNPPDYPTDFTTQDGDDIAAFFGGIPAQPIGMVSRVDYTGSGFSHFKTYSSWAGETATRIDEVAIADIIASATINGGTIETDAEVIYMGAQNGTYKIAVYLKENGIVAPQLLPDDTRDPDYIHENVFRASITAPMGEALASGAIADSASFTKSYTTPLDGTWDSSNLQIVVILIDDSNQEVMQVVQADVQ